MSQRTLIRILAMCSGVSFIGALVTCLWQMTLTSTFYFQGLHLNVFSNGVTGDLRELNILNHYIGMLTIGNGMPEFRYMGYAIGVLAAVSLFIAVIPRHKVLWWAFGLQIFVMLALAADFTLRLYQYGHTFNPDAPLKVAPFMPQIWGNYQLANFHVVTSPGLGSFLLILGLLFVVACHALEADTSKAI